MRLHEAYPDAWSMEHYMAIKSAKGRMDYAKQHLKKLGCGSARCAFLVDNEKVLKIAKSLGDKSKGMAQNELEASISNYSSIVAEVIGNADDYSWIESEKVIPFRNNKASRAKFKELTGMEFKVIESIVYANDDFNRAFDAVGENEFLHEYHDLIMSYGLHSRQYIIFRDYRDIAHYGVANRGGQESVVLLDYGLNDDIMDLYRKKMR